MSINTFDGRSDRATPKKVSEAKTEAKVKNMQETDKKNKEQIFQGEPEKKRDFRADREQKRNEVNKILMERREKMKRKSIPFFLVPEDDKKKKGEKSEKEIKEHQSESKGVQSMLKMHNSNAYFKYMLHMYSSNACFKCTHQIALHSG